MRTTLNPGDIFAGYRIESFVARGGMAVVYRAHDQRLQRDVALKLLGPDMAQSESFRKRFIQESLMAASLDHPNIVPVYDADTYEESLYIAMRYVPGPNLQEMLATTGAPELRHTLPLMAQVASALDAAHDLGLVHRDVKPGNILIAHRPTDEPGHVYLTDFGLTKRTSSLSGLTEAGHFLGTLDYIAPEQILGEPVSARSDVYALGCVLFEMLTGKIPFERPIDAAKIYAHLEDDPPSVRSLVPGLPTGLDPVVRQAMAKRPPDRYPTCSELVADLRAVLAPSDVPLSGTAGSRAVTPGRETDPGAPTVTGAALPALGAGAAGVAARVAADSTAAGAAAGRDGTAAAGAGAAGGARAWASAPTEPVDLTDGPGADRGVGSAARNGTGSPARNGTGSVPMDLEGQPTAGPMPTPTPTPTSEPAAPGPDRVARPAFPGAAGGAAPPNGPAARPLSPPGAGAGPRIAQPAAPAPALPPQRAGSRALALPGLAHRPTLALVAVVLAAVGAGTAAFALRSPTAKAAEAVLPFAAESYPDQGIDVSRTWVLRGRGDQLHGELLVTARTKRAASFVEVLPKSLAQAASDVDFKPSPARIVREDPVVQYTTRASAVYTYDVPVPAGPVQLERLRAWATAQQAETRRYFASSKQRAPLTVTQIALIPGALQLRAGGLPHQLQVTGTYSNGKPAPASAVSGALVQVDDPAVAAVDARRNVRPVGAGTATVTASLGAMSARAVVRVAPAPGAVAPAASASRTSAARSSAPVSSSPPAAAVPKVTSGAATPVAPARTPRPTPATTTSSPSPLVSVTTPPTDTDTTTPAVVVTTTSPPVVVTTTAPEPEVVTTTAAAPDDPPTTTSAAEPDDPPTTEAQPQDPPTTAAAEPADSTSAAPEQSSPAARAARAAASARRP